jgi:hypothetical protein
MVRVPGSSGDSGFHCESTEEDDVKIKMEPGIDVPTGGESPSTPLKQEGYTDRLSAGRSSGDVMEEDPALELEMKPQPLPRSLLGPPRIATQVVIRRKEVTGESQRTFFHKRTPPPLVPDQDRRRLRG